MTSNVLREMMEPHLADCHLVDIPASEEELINNIAGCFDSFKPYSMVVLSEIIGLVSQGRKSWLALLSINHTAKAIRLPQHEQKLTEYELVGIAILKRDYGKVYIRPETLGDKISELFVHEEVDFEAEPEFSRKYYVLTNNEENLRKTVAPRFLRIIARFDELEIEIQGKALVVRLRKAFTPEIGKLIAEFVAEINDGEN